MFRILFQLLPTRSDGVDWDDPSLHLGKRNGAGLYCWDCRVTLCTDGTDAIHLGKAVWLDTCPRCNKCKEDSYPSRFDRVAPETTALIAPAKPTGVAHCCSFTWAQDPHKALEVLNARPEELLVEDEYHTRFKSIDFLSMLNNMCPIHLEKSIGVRFS